MRNKQLKLNEEGEKQLDIYIDKWLKKRYCTDPIDVDKAVDIICELEEYDKNQVKVKVISEYEKLNNAKYKVNMDLKIGYGDFLRDWGSNRFFRKIVDDRKDYPKLNNIYHLLLFRLDRVRVDRHNFLLGDNYLFFLCFQDFVQNYLKIKINPYFRTIIKLFDYVNSFDFGYNHIILVNRPKKIAYDENYRFHDWDEPALVLASGEKRYYWRGIQVPYSTFRSKNNAKKIVHQSNVEVRRLLIDHMGIEKFITQIDAKVIHEDEYGTLYRRALWGDEPLTVVKVKNSTPEPDGTFKDYFIRVPNNFKTAKGAVAWTFGTTGRKYKPVKET